MTYEEYHALALFTSETSIVTDSLDALPPELYTAVDLPQGVAFVLPFAGWMLTEEGKEAWRNRGDPPPAPELEVGVGFPPGFTLEDVADD